MLCYSVTDRRSFRAAAEYKRLLAQARPSERLPLVLVGNKLDLAPRFRQVWIYIFLVFCFFFLLYLMRPVVVQ